MTQHTAYFSRVTEYEAGWGNRPDGFLIAKTEALFTERAKSIKAAGTYAEFSSVDHGPKLCKVTEEMHKQLEVKGTVWTNDKSWFVE